MSTQLAKRAMLQAFKQKIGAFMFLASFFQTPPSNIVRARTVDIDVKRNGEKVAVDVVRGTGGRLNINKRFTTKNYAPPVYDEYTSLFEEELNDRVVGEHEYNTPAYAAGVVARVTDDQAELQDMVSRAIEYQASQVMFAGTITLQNNESLDFKQKATHQITVGTAWSNVAADALGDLQGACTVVRKDGLVNCDIAIMGETAITGFLNNTAVKAILDNRRMERGMIVEPRFNTEGATFHGTISAGDYTLEIWTYPQFYEVPVGYGLANEGTKQPFVPADKVCVLSSRTRFDLVFAGIPQLVDRVSPELSGLGVTGVPQNVAGDFQPYAFTDDKKTCLQVGVRSAPLCIPTQIDGYAVLDIAP